MSALAKEANAKGYTGADIEGVVAESVESVFVKNGTELTTRDVGEAMANTHPLSEIMDLDGMRSSYEDKKFKKASR
jgi:SpoVK/Ycf46/Vps4 family AAA+-type ATPase